MIDKLLVICTLLAFNNQCYSQEDFPETPSIEPTFKTENKGKLYFYWGWNKAQYGYSDITFKGDDYKFTLYDVAAKDRQTQWDADVYLNPTNITIPQTVARIGYYFHDHWNLSAGFDHMK